MTFKDTIDALAQKIGVEIDIEDDACALKAQATDGTSVTIWMQGYDERGAVLTGADLGAKADNGVIGGWGATGKSGVSTGKSIGGAIAYRGSGSTLYVIDTTKIPKGEKAWDMEKTVYENGYKVRQNQEDDETMGEVNISTVPRNAIVGWLKIPPFVKIDNITDNAEKLAMLQNNPDCEIEFNPDYKTVSP